MSRLVLFLVLFVLLGGVAWWYLGTDSFILIRVGEWAIQIQLLTGLIGLILVMGFANGLFFLFDQTIGGRWIARARAGKSVRRQRDALIALISGRPIDAKDHLLKAANLNQDFILHTLMAAYAACEADQFDRALNILNKLEGLRAADLRAHWVLRARVMVELGRLDEADVCCAKARAAGAQIEDLSITPLRIAAARKDWDEYQRLAHLLWREKPARPALIEYERRVQLERMLSGDLNADSLQAMLDNQSPELRADDAMVEAHFHALVRLDRGEDAEKLLRDLLHRNWRPELLADYIRIPGIERETQITQLQKWRHRHGDSAPLLKALEQLTEDAGDWQQAQEIRRLLESTL